MTVSQKVHMLRCAASFVTSTYKRVRLIPQDLRALPMELFAKPFCDKGKLNFADKRGYTLIELMISITMMGLILVIMGMAIRLGVRSVDSGERRIGSLERFRSSLEIVDAQIQSELPATTQEEAGEPYVFKGDSGSMQFPSNYSLWGSKRGYVNVSYKVVSDAWGKQELHASESTMGEAGMGDVRLFDFFDRIYFEYFEKDPAEEHGKWVDKWVATSEAPEKIRLHLIDGRSDKTFVISVKVRDPQSVVGTGTDNTSGAANTNG